MTQDCSISNNKNRSTSIVESVRHKLRATKLRSPLVWIRHQRVRPSDAFLASFHRSGNTWMRFLLCEILTHHAADFKTVGFAIPDFSFANHAWPVLSGGGRVMRTHEPYHSCYKKAIYFVRDPRDVAVSCFEFYRTGQDMDSFLRSWVAGKTNAHGTWYRHVSSWANSPLVEDGNLLIIKYEHMRLDTEGTLAEVLRFLGTAADRVTIQRAIANNNLEKMRAKEERARATGEGFAGQRIRGRGLRIRIGSIGQWKDRLTEAQVQLIEDHAGELLTRFGYSHERDLVEAAPYEELSESDTASDLLPEVGEASA